VGSKDGAEQQPSMVRSVAERSFSTVKVDRHWHSSSIQGICIRTCLDMALRRFVQETRGFGREHRADFDKTEMYSSVCSGQWQSGCAVEIQWFCR
jgi:hypothetical protein